MPDRDKILATLDGGLAARARGDKAAMAAFLAPGATFRIAGDRSAFGQVRPGPARARDVLGDLVDLISFHDYERLDTIVEGDRAAVRWRIDFSIGGGPVATTEILDLWTFDEEGRIADLVQFVDTALLERMLPKD
ncbi:MAG TPA: nuclear transport factor 2 family protein [Allosphingosinicella sp.]|nr:nuclear transport factor 2 family protein [Allosphingosinicella sp.]